MIDTMQFQERWPEIHSDKVKRAVRCIPTDVALSMPTEWLDETVRSIVREMEFVADEVSKFYKKED